MGVQKEPSNYEKQLVALERALQAIRDEKDVDRLVKIALNYLRAEFAYTLVWIGLYHRSKHRLLGKGGAVAGHEPAILRQTFDLSPGELLEQVVMQQRPLGVPDLRQEARAGEWRSTAQQHNIQGTVIFPVHHRTQCFGVVLLGSSLWGTSPHSEEKARLSMILGGMAEALSQIELAQQQQQTKRPEVPLGNLMSKLRSLPTLEKRLAAVVEETQQFIAPDCTSIYWYEPHHRYFWRRLGHRGKSLGEAEEAIRIPVQEVNSFYQALTADQLLVVGEAQGSLKADLTGRLVQQIQARSLITAPILFQGELRGFLTVEGNEPRLWSEEEKNYVRAAANLLALAAPLEEMEETIRQVKLDQALTAEVSHGLYSEADWKKTLKNCAEQVCRRLRAERFIVLLHDRDQKHFEIVYQHQPHSRRQIMAPLPDLNPVDWQMLERSPEAVGIENLQDDLKLMAWRSAFLELDLRSLLLCSTAIGHPLEGIVVIGQEAPRSWNRAERELLRVVSQQTGLLLHQLQLQRQTDQLQALYQMVQSGLSSIQQLHELGRLEQAAVQQIAQLLQVPLATLVTWQPGCPTAHIAAPTVTRQSFAIATDVPIPVYTDVLLQSALQTDGLLSVQSSQIMPETRQWLSGKEIGQVLVMALRTAPEHEPTGVVLVADQLDRRWSELQLSAFGTLSGQLAWCRRYLLLTEKLTAQRETLEQLNWYKQRRLQEIYRVLGVGTRRLHELNGQQDAAASLRYQRILRHFGSTLTAVAPVLRHEQWQLHGQYETLALASLLKRTLERVDGLIKQRQLWSQVHNEANLSIGGDISKIEFVLHEVLAAACHRSPTGARLDIWCRQLDSYWLELAVTDQGAIEPRLIEELETGRQRDLLTPSTLDSPPGRHLSICQSLMQQLGADFNLYELEDGRVVSRLLIPIASGISPVQAARGEISSFF